MAKTETFHCSLVTPEAQVLDSDVRFVAIPAHDGEIGFLVDRAPLVCKLGSGGLRIDAPEKEHRFFLDGGFAEMFDNTLTILTPHAERVEDIDPAQADADLKAAVELPAEDQASRDAKKAAVARARARRHVVATARR